jgi:hypothetical protein
MKRTSKVGIKEKSIKAFGDRPSALALFTDLGVGRIPNSGAHSYLCAYLKSLHR